MTGIMIEIEIRKAAAAEFKAANGKRSVGKNANAFSIRLSQWAETSFDKLTGRALIMLHNNKLRTLIVDRTNSFYMCR